MKKNQIPALPLDEQLSLHCKNISEFHKIAIDHATQAVGAAMVVGLGLLAVQEMLKRNEDSHQVRFLTWFNENQSLFGFSARTKDKYIKLAEHVKRGLILGGSDKIKPLLDIPSSQLTEEQRKTLLNEMRKSVDGSSLTQLYQEYEIVKMEQLPNRGKQRPDNQEDAPVSDIPIEVVPAESSNYEQLAFNLVYEPFSLFKDKFFSTSRKIGKDRIQAFAEMSKPARQLMLQELSDIRRALEESLR